MITDRIGLHSVLLPLLILLLKAVRLPGARNLTNYKITEIVHAI